MTQDQAQGSDAVDPTRVAQLLREVLQQVDDGSLHATAPQRAHLLGAAQAMELMAEQASRHD